MPPKKAKKPEGRCTYREKGHQCPRNGTGNPFLCRAHRIVIEDRGRPKADRSALGDIFDSFANGKKVKSKTIFDAVREMASMFPGAIPTSNSFPHIRNTPPWTPPIQPPVDPFEAEREACRRARTALGYAPSDPLSEAELKNVRRKLAKKYHPDRGGSQTRMQEINDAVDVLLDGIEKGIV